MKELEKIDVIRERTGASYEEAAEALKVANGDVLKAIVTLEKEAKRGTKVDQFEVRGRQVVETVKKLIKKGNARRIKVKQDNRVLLDIPVTAGVVGTAISPFLAVLGAATALLTKCTIEVERVNKDNNIDKRDKV